MLSKAKNRNDYDDAETGGEKDAVRLVFIHYRILLIIRSIWYVIIKFQTVVVELFIRQPVDGTRYMSILVQSAGMSGLLHQGGTGRIIYFDEINDNNGLT